MAGVLFAFIIFGCGNTLSPPAKAADRQEPDQPLVHVNTSTFIELTFGDGQGGRVGEVLAEPLRVRVVDGQDAPVSGAEVVWAVMGGGGSITPERGVTDGGGYAEARWTLGSQPGENTVSASVEGAGSVVFTATGSAESPGTVRDLAVAATTESTVTLRWTQVDDGTGRRAKYAIRYGSPSLSWGSAYPTEVSVEGTGIGTVLEYTRTGLDGGTDYEFALVPYRGVLNAGAVFGGFSNAVSASTEDPDQVVPASVVVVSGDGQEGGAGEVLPLPLVVEVRDAQGAGLSGVSVSWAVTTQGGGSVSSASTVTDAVGQAQVTWTLGSSAGSHVVEATAGGVRSASFYARATAGLPTDGPVFTDGFEEYGEESRTLGHKENGFQWEAGDGSSAIGGTGANGRFTRSSGTWVVNSMVGVPVHLGSTGYVDDIGVFTVTSNTETVLFFEGDATGAEWIRGKRPRVSTDRAYSGSKSLKFIFGPDPVGEDSRSEQRFTFGEDLAEFWVEYQLWIPSNYAHRSGPGPDNNKFLIIVGNNQTTGPVMLDFEVMGNPATGGSSPFTQTNSERAEAVRIKDPQVRVNDLISSTGAIRPGQWTRIRIHGKTSTGPGVADGVFEAWAGGTLIFQKTDGVFWYAPQSPNYQDDKAVFHNGYIIGYANSGFDEETLIYVDDFKIYAGNPGW